MKKWFVLYVRPRQELKVLEQLESLGIVCYCPTVSIIRQYSDRKKKIQKPIISSYVMVYLDDSARNSVFAVKGVIRYLFWLGKPAEIKPYEINQMKKYLKGIYEDFYINTLVKNEIYKINQGPFLGHIGKVVESQKNKVKLEVKSLGVVITLKRQAA